jgi:hypothetical protein
MNAVDVIYLSMIAVFCLSVTCFVLPFARVRPLPEQYVLLQRRARVPLLISGAVLLVVSFFLFLLAPIVTSFSA